MLLFEDILFIFSLCKFTFFQFWSQHKLRRAENEKIGILKGLELKRHKLTRTKNKQKKKLIRTKIEKAQTYKD